MPALKLPKSAEEILLENSTLILSMERTDGGYDYSLYEQDAVIDDDPVDGGVIELTDPEKAVHEICLMHGIEPNSLKRPSKKKANEFYGL